MPVCANRSCRHKQANQDEGRFIYNDRKYRQCFDCYQTKQRYLERKRNGIDPAPAGFGPQLSHRVNGESNMKKGDPPAFLFEWEEKMHMEYIKDLIKQVQRG